MTAEALVKKEIKKGLAEMGVWYFMPVQSGYGKRTVDFICCHKGRFVAIEAKAGANRTSKYQDLILAEIENAGGIAIVAYDWGMVYERIKSI
jgi:hypothetical protein